MEVADQVSHTLLHIMCDRIPLIDALFSISANFINGFLKSDNLTDSAVGIRAVYYSLVHSSLGISEFNCCIRYNVQTGDISVIHFSLVNCYVRSLVMNAFLSKALYY